MPNTGNTRTELWKTSHWIKKERQLLTNKRDDKGNKIGEIQEILIYYGIEPVEAKAVKMTGYLEMMERNRLWAGLTSKRFKEENTAAVADSIAVVQVFGIQKEKRVADLGAGGGLLGLVLAICCEEWGVTLVESASRKATFLAEAIGALGIDNARVVNARAESLLGAEEFNLVVSRAAGKLKDLVPIALGLLEKGGQYVALKASQVDEEIADAMTVIEAASGRVAVVRPIAPLPFVNYGARASLVVVEKL